MNFYADPANDLPSPFKPKRCIFYTQGLKVYGQIPYILQKRLQAEFYSNNMPCLGGRIVAPTAEANYTVVPYRRRDEQPHSQEAIDELLTWLYEGKGFEVAIAADFDKSICDWNAFQMPPETWIPAEEDYQDMIRGLLGDGQ